VKRANGQRISGRIPYGYDLGEDGVTLVTNKVELMVITNIAVMRSNGMTLKQIAEALTQRGVPTKTGKSQQWTHQAVARILARNR
jgi:DNA phosphorothioation-dependent restriction protein DptG